MAETPDPEAPKPKKNFFKKPAWLVAQAKSEEKPEQKQDATDIFSRSTGSVSEMLAEQKRKEQIREEKRARAAMKSIESPVVKRRKVSGDNDYSDATGDEKQDSISPLPAESRKKSSKSSPRSLEKRYEAAASSNQKKQAAVIDVSDDSASDSDEPTYPLTSVGTRISPRKHRPEPGPAQLAVQPEDEDEVEDFPELAKKARERARQQELDRQRAEARANSNSSEYLTASRIKEGPNPVINIMVTSNIQGANPLLVKRKWNQNFGDIRKAWLSMQSELPETIKSQVYFTWRGKKVFDIASCRSLGIKLDEDGQPLFPAQKTFSDGNERVVLEATTDAQLKAEREAEAEKQRKEQELEEAKYAPTTANEKRNDQIRFILKAKNLPDQKLKAKPETTIERVMESFRLHHKFDESKQVALLLDGDELSPDDTITDAGIEDMDMVEVIVK